MEVFGTIKVICEDGIELYTSKEWECGDGCCSETEYEGNYHELGEVIAITEKHILRDGTFPEFSPDEVIITAVPKKTKVHSTLDKFGNVTSLKLVKV